MEVEDAEEVEDKDSGVAESCLARKLAWRESWPAWASQFTLLYTSANIKRTPLDQICH